MKDQGSRRLAIGATALAVFSVGGCAVSGDDPKRTFSLLNETGDPRLVRRCDDGFDCRNPDEGELVRPRESFDFELYFDEDRTYVVADADGTTLGCLAVPLADGSDPPNSLSDLEPCPTGTPRRAGARSARRRATLATFARYWWGHSRGLRITATGRATERIGDGCCNTAVEYEFRLMRPRGTVAHGSVVVRVTSVERWRASWARRPRVGRLGELRLRHGVITDSVSGARFCAPGVGPPRVWDCGV